MFTTTQPIDKIPFSIYIDAVEGIIANSACDTNNPIYFDATKQLPWSEQRMVTLSENVMKIFRKEMILNDCNSEST